MQLLAPLALMLVPQTLPSLLCSLTRLPTAGADATVAAAGADADTANPCHAC